MSAGDDKQVRRHLRREARTALELAIAALAPPALVDRLAAVAGILEALEDLPADTAPVRVMSQSVVERARTALEDWQKWRVGRGLDAV